MASFSHGLRCSNVSLLLIFCLSVSPVADAHRESARARHLPLLWEQEIVFRQVLEWAQEQSILMPQQHRLILDELNRQFEELLAKEDSVTATRRRIYGLISERLTVPTLIYGALLAVAFCTMFVAIFIGWHSMQSGKLFVVTLAYMFFFMWSGGKLYDSEQWQILGGMLYSIPIMMTPITVYELEKILGMWPNLEHIPSYPSKNGALVAMELATIAFGMFLAYLVPFSFFVVPMLLAIWFLLLHATPLVLGRRDLQWHEIQHLATAFGGALTLLAHCTEKLETKYYVWIYLSGCLALISGTTLQLVAGKRSREVVYLSCHILLIYLADSSQKLVLLVTGACGVLGYAVYGLKTKQCLPSSAALSLFRVIGMAILLAISVARYSPGMYQGLLEFCCSYTLFALCGLSWLRKMCLSFRLPVAWIHLAVQVCFALTAQSIHLQYDLIFFQLDARRLMLIAAAVSTVVNNVITSLHLLESPDGGGACAIQVGLLFATALLSRVIPTEAFAVSSVVSLLCFSWIALIYKQPDFRKTPHLILIHWLILIIAYAFARLGHVQSLQWVAMAMLLYTAKLALSVGRDTVLVATAIGYLAVGSLLQTHSFSLIGGGLFQIWGLRCIRAKLGKSSRWLNVINIFVLSILILFFFLGATRTQLWASGRLARISNLTDAQRLSASVMATLRTTWMAARERINSRACGGLSSWILATNAIPCVLAIAIALNLGPELVAFLAQEMPIDEDAPPKIVIKAANISFPRDTDQCGIVVEFTATKDPDFSADSAALHVDGEEFWNALSGICGIHTVNRYYQTVCLMKLFPNRLSKQAINKRADRIKFWLQLGTGKKNEPKISQTSIRSTLRKLVNYGDPTIVLRAIYNSKAATPRRATLFEVKFKASQILNSIKEGLLLQPLLKHW